jgi:Rieske Fe-S protein
LKVFAAGAVASSFQGKTWVQTYASEVLPSPNSPGKFTVKLSDYPVLNNEFSSIRLSVNPMLGDFPHGRFYPILVNRGEGEQFYALNSECRHASCIVPAYNEPNGGIVCPCHGSVYLIDGSVLPDQPAFENLRTYPISFDGNDTLTIEVPELGYNVAGAVVQDGTRFRLDFRAYAHVEYEVRHRATLTQDWGVVPFALDAEAPADQLALDGGNNDHDATIYVDRAGQAGFYAVSMRLLDLTEA